MQSRARRDNARTRRARVHRLSCPCPRPHLGRHRTQTAGLLLRQLDGNENKLPPTWTAELHNRAAKWAPFGCFVLPPVGRRKSSAVGPKGASLCSLSSWRRRLSRHEAARRSWRPTCGCCALLCGRNQNWPLINRRPRRRGVLCGHARRMTRWRGNLSCTLRCGTSD